MVVAGHEPPAGAPPLVLDVLVANVAPAYPRAAPAVCVSGGGLSEAELRCAGASAGGAVQKGRGARHLRLEWPRRPTRPARRPGQGRGGAKSRRGGSGRGSNGRRCWVRRVRPARGGACRRGETPRRASARSPAARVAADEEGGGRGRGAAAPRRWTIGGDCAGRPDSGDDEGTLGG